jgi:hypothetical protein
MMRPQDSPAHIPQRVGSMGATTPMPNRANARSASLSGYDLFLVDGEPRMRCNLFPRNLGDPVVSSATSRPELPGYQLQASAAHSSAGERKERVNAGGTAKRRQRSAAGRAAGSRSALIVPSKQGNSPRRTLGREARRRPADPGEGNMGSTSRLRSMSPELARIASGTVTGRQTCRSRNRML